MKLKRRSGGEDPPVEINVTPMIDMFSVILSFLLMTAVFTSTGVHIVQIPFLSSAPPDDREKDPKVVTTATLLIDNDEMKLELSKSNASRIEETKTFRVDEEGLSNLRMFLYEKRVEEPEFDRVTVMTADDTRYETLIHVLDAMRFLKEGMEPIPPPESETEGQEDSQEEMLRIHSKDLISKIILGNVIL
jgi:biopolymer transport protein ExbD